MNKTLFTRNNIFPLLLCSTLLIAQDKGGRWQFENNGDDTAAWDQVANTGEPVNQAVYGTETPLQEGSCYLNLDPDSVNAAFRVPDNQDLDFENEKIGISMWVYPLGFSDTQFLMTKGIQNTNPKTANYGLRLEASSGMLSFLVRDANNQAQVVTSTIAVAPDMWTFVAAFYDYTNEKVYFWNSLSSVPADSAAYTQALFPNDGPLEIGSWYTSDGTGVKHFKGRIDDVRLSSRLVDVVPLEALAIRDYSSGRASNKPVSIRLYPNPISFSNKHGQLAVRISSPNNANTQMAVYNLLGKNIYSSMIQLTRPNYDFVLQLNDVLSSQPVNGIYFIAVMNAHGSTVQKFTVLK